MKQIDAYQHIYRLVLKTSSDLLDLIKIGDQEKLSRIREIGSEFNDISRIYWIILPHEIRGLLVNFEDSVWAIENAIIDDPHNEDVERMILIGSHYLNDLFNTFRETMGIEKLHEETLRLIGANLGGIRN